MAFDHERAVWELNQLLDQIRDKTAFESLSKDDRADLRLARARLSTIIDKANRLNNG